MMSILEPIVNAFLNLMIWINQFLSTSLGVEESFGWTIIIFTIGIRLALFPFTRSQLKSTQKQQDMYKSPEWEKIQKKYKDDKEKLAQEQMRMMQELGVNPLGACLPSLLQLPIIFALYYSITRAMAATPTQFLALVDTVNVKQLSALPLNSSFLWMDLSQPERLYLPFLSFGIPVLAILVTVTSYLQTKMTTATTPTNDDQSQQMTKMMTLWMPLFIGYLSYQYAAGLALYFFVGNIATIIQYAAMGRLKLSNLFSKN